MDSNGHRFSVVMRDVSRDLAHAGLLVLGQTRKEVGTLGVRQVYLIAIESQETDETNKACCFITGGEWRFGGESRTISVGLRQDFIAITIGILEKGCFLQYRVVKLILGPRHQQIDPQVILNGQVMHGNDCTGTKLCGPVWRIFTSLMTQKAMPDMQNTRDERNIAIDHVGVRGVQYPIRLLDRRNEIQNSIGNFTLTVDLPKHFKGTHMSRFLEVLGEHDGVVSVESIPEILTELRLKLDSEQSTLDVDFVYFISKPAPVTGKPGLMGYDCRFEATGGTKTDMVIQVRIPVTTLCPCSKEISDYGAHNQRGYVTVRVRTSGLIWIEEIIEMIEARASAPLYPLLKRPDEKFVTELAYNNPRFVEDMVREIALAFDTESRITWYRVEVENHESIHAHNAYASIERSKG